MPDKEDYSCPLGVSCPRCGACLMPAPGDGAFCEALACNVVLTKRQLRRYQALCEQGQRGETLLRLGALGEIIKVGPRMQGVRERTHQPIYDSLDVSKR